MMSYIYLGTYFRISTLKFNWNLFCNMEVKAIGWIIVTDNDSSRNDIIMWLSRSLLFSIMEETKTFSTLLRLLTVM